MKSVVQSRPSDRNVNLIENAKCVFVCLRQPYMVIIRSHRVFKILPYSFPICPIYVSGIVRVRLMMPSVVGAWKSRKSLRATFGQEQP